MYGVSYIAKSVAFLVLDWRLNLERITIRTDNLVTLKSGPFIQSSLLILIQQSVYLIKSCLTKTLGRHRYPKLI